MIAVLMIVLISGCTSDDGPTVSKGYGLEITNFTSSLGTLYSLQTSHVSMRIENRGESKAMKDNGLVLLTIPSDWEVTQDLNLPFKKDITFANPNTGTDPGSEYFTWTVKAPAISAGITRPDIIRGRVFYDYETKATGNIVIYPESELLADKEAGRKLSTSSFQYSRAPVTVSMSLPQDPVSVYSDGETFSINFEFNNIGGGAIYKPGIVTADDYKIEDTERNILDLDVSIAGLEIDETCFDNIQFFKETAIAMCDVTVEPVPITSQTYPITLSATYGYYIEDTVDIKVIGKD